MKHTIRNRYVELVFDEETGTLASLRNLTTGDDCRKHATSQPIFALYSLEGDGYGEKTEHLPGKPVSVRKEEADGMRRLAIEYTDAADGKLPFRATVTIELGEDSRDTVWRLELRNGDSDRRIVEVMFPYVRGLGLGRSWEDDILIYPHHAGEKTINPVSAYASDKYAGFWRAQTIREDYGYSREINYCGLASMTWMYLYDAENGLYLGSHDERFPVTGLRVETGGPRAPWMGFGFRKHARIVPGGSWTSGDAVIALTDRNWHWGAKRYRQWIDRHIAMPEHPERMKDQYILNQCYNFKRETEILNRFVDIPRMYDAGKAEFGMDHMFIASWNRKGFDADYPEYQPDMELGTPWELYQGVDYVNENGGFATFYINARIFDIESDFFPSLGRRWAIHDHSGATMDEEYGPHKFTVSCPSHKEWTRYLLDMSRWMVRSYGATGIYLDQLGSADPYPCHRPDHSHADVGEFNAGYVELLRELLPEVKRFNPEGFLMIENCGDIYGSYVWGNLTWNGEKYDEFFDLYKYTFPEYVQVNMVNPRRGLEGKAQEDQLRRDMARAMRLGAVLWIGREKNETLAEGSKRFMQRSVGLRRRLQPLMRDGVFAEEEGVAALSEGVTASRWRLAEGGDLYVVSNLARSDGAYLDIEADGRTSVEAALEDVDGGRLTVTVEAEGGKLRLPVTAAEIGAIVVRPPGGG